MTLRVSSVSEFDDIFGEFAHLDEGPHIPKIRVYLESESRPSAATLSGQLPQYQWIASHSHRDIVLIRKITFESAEQFRLECDRVARTLAPHVPPHSALTCMYDDDQGTTRFQIDLRKPGDGQEFIVTAPQS
jgi:hypothetical protein